MVRRDARDRTSPLLPRCSLVSRSSRAPPVQAQGSESSRVQISGFTVHGLGTCKHESPRAARHEVSRAVTSLRHGKWGASASRAERLRFGRPPEPQEAQVRFQYSGLRVQGSRLKGHEGERFGGFEFPQQVTTEGHPSSRNLNPKPEPETLN